MRKCPVCLILLLCAGLGFAKPATVSGIAVSTHWYGGYGQETGGSGNIMKFVVRNGVTTDTSTLFAGPARYATISPDGKNVAFIKSTKAIAVMSVNGGTPQEVVTGLPESNGCIDWPTGDWLYYNKGGRTSDSSRTIWKVNVKTLEKALVCSFDTTDVWTFQSSLDGKRFCIRQWDAGIYKFELASGAPPVVSIVSGSGNYYSGGCGASLSPAGATMMCLETPTHTQIAFGDWNYAQSTGTKWPIRRLNLRVMCRWAGQPFVDTLPDTTGTLANHTGGGMDNNRWSCNSEKWICIRAGWGSRGAGGGGNQVLVNWLDSQIVRTSMNIDSRTIENGNQNEAGDFWVDTSLTVLKKIPFAPVNPTLSRGTYRVSLGQAGTGLAGNSSRLWDIRGCSVKKTSACASKMLIIGPLENVTKTY
jgi:hypothetical protein